MAAFRVHIPSSARVINPDKNAALFIAAFPAIFLGLLLLDRRGRRRRSRLIRRRGLGLFCGGCFVRARARQNPLERVIAFMAGILEYTALRSAEFVLAAPRTIPNGRILSLELIKNTVRSDTREAFRHLQLLPRSAQRRGFRKIGGLD